MTADQFNDLAESSKVKSIFAWDHGGLSIEFENGVKVSAGIDYSQEEFYLGTEEEAQAEQQRIEQENQKRDSAPVLIIMGGKQRWVDRDTFNSIIKPQTP